MSNNASSNPKDLDKNNLSNKKKKEEQSSKRNTGGDRYCIERRGYEGEGGHKKQSKSRKCVNSNEV